MCGIVKLLVSSSMGTIPANIHCDRLNLKIEALKENRIKVVTENTPWPGDIIAGVTSMGFGGVNTFALLSFEGTDDEPEFSYPRQIPILVPFSGRTAETLKTSLKEIADLRDERVIKLLHEITAGQSIKGYPTRGYTLIGSKEMRIMSVEEKVGPMKPPAAVVFIFSGMGSHINGMLDIFKDFPAYRESIERSERYLLDRGYDLRSSTAMGTSERMEDDDIIASSVGITCFQIAIVDLLSSMGILPDMFVGHSVGELLCAYVDGHFSQEQILHLALLRALVIRNTKEMDGSAQAKEKLRLELEAVAGHNETPSERWIQTLPGSSPNDHISSMSKTVADVVVNMTSAAVDFENKIKVIPDGSLLLEIAPQCNLQSATRETILSLSPNSTTKVLNVTRHGGGSDN